MSDHMPDAGGWPADLREELALFFAILGPDPTAAQIRDLSHTLSPEARLYLARRDAVDASAVALPPVAPAGDDPPPAG